MTENPLQDSGDYSTCSKCCFDRIERKQAGIEKGHNDVTSSSTPNSSLNTTAVNHEAKDSDP